MPRLTRPRTEIPASGASGHVKKAPTSLTGSMLVVVPDFSRRHTFQIRRWMPRGTDLPAVGDLVLVVTDEQNEPWVVAWWPA